MSGEDVYDVARVEWCSLCQAPHEPCETNEDGEQYVFEPEEEDE